MMRALLMMCVVSALLACSQHLVANPDGGDAGAGGNGGNGAVGGSGSGGNAGNAGSSGSGGNAGSAGAGAITGGSGGVSGSSGSGGFAGDCATRPPIDDCPALAEGWFAVKTTLDVWWPGTPIRDPGRGEINVTALAFVSTVCDGGGGANPSAVVKLCDVTLPPFTSDVFCDAYQLTIPYSAWESPVMPRFVTTTSFMLLSPGNPLLLTPWVGLLGIDLINGNERSAWPSEIANGALTCEDGMGIACFVDHDNDGRRGITAQLRTDQATYVGPNDNGLCSNGIAYRYAGMPATIDISAGGGAPNQVVATAVHLGARTDLGVSGEIASTCNHGEGATTATSFDLRAAGCVVDPTTLYPGSPGYFDPDPRLASMDYACIANEARLIDESMPAYQVLPAGGVPGETQRLLGWEMIGRDIDKSPSAGPKSRWVHVASLSDVEPTCARVRNVMQEYMIR